jgi:hypothetical protein
MRRDPPKTFFSMFSLSLRLKLPTLFSWRRCDACKQEFRRVWWWEIGWQNPVVVCGHCCWSEADLIKWFEVYRQRWIVPARGGSGSAPPAVVDPKFYCDPFRPAG